MQTLQSIEAKGTAAVKRLRRQKLASGIPFMINDTNLPSGQCYLEYPNGSIQLVTLSTDAKNFDEVRELSEQESILLRMKYGLSD